MAEIDFPDTPVIGEVYDQWTWNGELWVLTPPPPPPPDKLGFTFVQDAMPTATRAGDTWWQGLSGASYVWVVDSDSSQWVQFAPSAPTTGPVGTIVDYIGTTPPVGWLALIGQTIANGESFYPALWAVLPPNLKSGTDIILPDTRSRTTFGLYAGDPAHDTIGKIGGAASHVLTQAEMPNHSHLVTSPGGHSWGAYWGGGTLSTTFGFAVATVNSASQYGTQPLTADAMGGSAAHNNLPPYVTLLKILRVV